MDESPIESNTERTLLSFLQRAERNATRELHGRRWKASATSPSMAQAVADTSTSRTAPLRDTIRIAAASAFDAASVTLPLPLLRLAIPSAGRRAAPCEARAWVTSGLRLIGTPP